MIMFSLQILQILSIFQVNNFHVTMHALRWKSNRWEFSQKISDPLPTLQITFNYNWRYNCPHSFLGGACDSDHRPQLLPRIQPLPGAALPLLLPPGEGEEGEGGRDESGRCSGVSWPHLAAVASSTRLETRYIIKPKTENYVSVDMRLLFWGDWES